MFRWLILATVLGRMMWATTSTESCDVEVKLLIDVKDPSRAAALLGFGEARSREVSFYDTEQLELLRMGVILRFREGSKNDITVKLRGQDTADANKAAVKGVKCEGDMSGGHIQQSYSLSEEVDNDAPKNGKTFRKRLEKSQRQFLQAEIGEIDWKRVKRIAKVNSTEWKTSPNRSIADISLEHWSWRGGHSLLEVSARAKKAQASEVNQQLRKLIGDAGLKMADDQSPKTELVLRKSVN